MYNPRTYRDNNRLNERSDDSLLRAFGVTADDLAHNRNNRIAPGQAAKLRAESIRISVIICLFAAGLAALTIATAPLASSDLIILYVVFGLIFAFGVGLNFGVTTLALAPGAVSKRQGMMYLYGPPEGLTPRNAAVGMPEMVRLRVQQRGSYRVIIGDVMLRISVEQHKALRPFAGVYMTLYFVPTINRIVAVERHSASLDTLPDAAQDVHALAAGEPVELGKDPP